MLKCLSILVCIFGSIKCIIIINIATCQHEKGPHKSTLQCDVISNSLRAVLPRALLGERLSHVRLCSCPDKLFTETSIF